MGTRPSCRLRQVNVTMPAELIQEYEAKIAPLERMVGRQALEIELLKGALKHAPRPRSATTSVVTGPAPSPSGEGAS
jgi:transposase